MHEGEIQPKILSKRKFQNEGMYYCPSLSSSFIIIIIAVVFIPVLEGLCYVSEEHWLY
jgi:hypothetical protein